jgi:single-strand DNA-binding protein
MASLNKITLIGNTGSEPEMRFTPSGKPVTTFSLATNMKFKEETHTEWHNIVTWGKLAEFCNQYINKGQQLYVEGRIQTRKWEGNDGQTHYKTEVIANTVLLLGAKKQTEESEQAEETELEELPF